MNGCEGGGLGELTRADRRLVVQIVAGDCPVAPQAASLSLPPFLPGSPLHLPYLAMG